MSAASTMCPAGGQRRWRRCQHLGRCFVRRTRAVKCVVTCGSAWFGSDRRPISWQSATISSPLRGWIASTVTVRGFVSIELEGREELTSSIASMCHPGSMRRARFGEGFDAHDAWQHRGTVDLVIMKERLDRADQAWSRL